MKKRIIYIILGCLLAFLYTSCGEDSLSDVSVIDETEIIKNEFDHWLDVNYVEKYNIEFKYRYEDIESDMNYTVEPAKFEKSIRMAKMIKYLCLESYDEHTGNTDFIRKNYPKILFMVGSPAYKNNGTIVLATAENGYKITINNVNSLGLNKLTESDLKVLNNYYFHTLHHEFAHILHQTIPYTRDFEQISGTQYIQDSWSSHYENDNEALVDGFISSYASSDVNEDFVEIYSIYITSTQAEWDAKILTARGYKSVDEIEEGKADPSPGGQIINMKLFLVREYMSKHWKLDMDAMREIVLRRQSEVLNLDLDTLN